MADTNKKGIILIFAAVAALVVLFYFHISIILSFNNLPTTTFTTTNTNNRIHKFGVKEIYPHERWKKMVGIYQLTICHVSFL